MTAGSSGVPMARAHGNGDGTIISLAQTETESRWLLLQQAVNDNRGITTGEKMPEETIKSGGQRYCRRCLLRELGEEQYFKNLYDYIANLDAELKVSDELYEERLSRCLQCENLLRGMCRICGCYVELRAVMKKNSCPMGKPRW